MKNNTFKIQIVLLFLIGSLFCYSQSQTVVGSITGGIPSLSVSESTLKSAFDVELNDGSTCNEVKIEQASNGTYLLVGYSTLSSFYLTTSVELQVVNTNQLVINDVRKKRCNSDCGKCKPDACLCPTGAPDRPCTFLAVLLINGPNHLGNFY